MKKYWLLLAVPLLLLIWWGFGHGQSAPVVHFAAVRNTRIESTIATNGKVEPAQYAAARAQAAGVVREVDIQRGQNVVAGQPLVKLDTVAAASTLAAAQAQAEQARAENQTVAQGGKASALASINDTIATAQESVAAAQRSYDSLRRLQQQQAATKQQVLDAKDALDRAKLQLKAAQNQKATLTTAADKAVAEAKLRDAQAAVSLAQHQLAIGAITAPMAGTVYQFDLKVGAYLQPGELVALVGNLDQMKVTVYVDEPDLGRAAVGMPVIITWDARPGQQWKGVIDKMPTEVVSLGSRTVGEVTTIVGNPQHDLLPGVSVNATIISKVVADAATIPKAALRTLQNQDGVYKLQGDTIHWTPVKTGVSDINNVQIVSGLQQGDKVADRVVDPTDAEIIDGMHVKPAF